MCHHHIMHMFQSMRFRPRFEHMYFCSCFRRKKKLKKEYERELKLTQTAVAPDEPISEAKDVGFVTTKARKAEPSDLRDLAAINSRVKVFEYRDLATATNNFRSDCVVGEGGFGQVYKGKIAGTSQAVAVKVLNQTGPQGDKEFLVEVLMLSLLHHPNLVSMVGYCAEGNQRLLVYEYMPFGSLEYHLHDLTADMAPLDWNTRMKIAVGAARGLDYLHNQADPPVIYRDLKCSNILLDEEFQPKLSDFGLAKFGPEGDKSHVSTRVMGTHGYCAPEYASTGRLTKMSDIYCFGVVLMELITGKRAYDPSRGRSKETLVNWVRPFLKDRKDFTKIADPKLKGHVPEFILCRTIEVAGMCLRDKAGARPTGADMVKALDYLCFQSNEGPGSNPKSKIDRDGNEQDGEVTKDKVEKPKTPEIFSAKDDMDREQAVAEAKQWGEAWREKKQRTSVVLSMDGLDR